MRVYLVLIFILLYTNVIGQTYKYDILVFGKKIGTVITKRIHDGNYCTYISDSKSEVSFFGKKKIVTAMKTVYKDSILESSFYRVKKNNKIKENAVITYNNDIYSIITNGEETTHKKPVKLSTIMLTYYQPKNGDKVFEEVGGFYKTIKKISTNKFNLINPESRHVDSYIYNNKGILKECIVRKTLFNFKMVLQEEKK